MVSKSVLKILMALTKLVFTWNRIYSKLAKEMILNINNIPVVDLTLVIILNPPNN
jgi:hypothetical protein